MAREEKDRWIIRRHNWIGSGILLELKLMFDLDGNELQ